MSVLCLFLAVLCIGLLSMIVILPGDNHLFLFVNIIIITIDAVFSLSLRSDYKL